MWYFFGLMYSRIYFLSTFEGALYLMCEIGVKSLTLEMLPDDLMVAYVACSATARNLRFCCMGHGLGPVSVASIRSSLSRFLEAVCMMQQAAAGSCSHAGA